MTPMPNEPTDGLSQPLTRKSLLQRAGVVAAAAGLGSLAGCGQTGNGRVAVSGDVNAAAEGYLPPARQPFCNIHQFFTPEEAETVDAIVGRLIPGTDADPGAREACVPAYIDSKLARFASFATPTYFHGPFAKPSKHNLGAQVGATKTIYVEKADLERYGFQSSLTPQEAYRDGLVQLDALTRAKHGKRFAELGDKQQDAILEALEADKVKSFKKPTGMGFFKMLLEDTYEGMFADPMYGGNQNFAGWKLIGYPGAQRAYTAYELQHGPQKKRVQGLREMPPMNPGRPSEHAILPISGTRRTAVKGG